MVVPVEGDIEMSVTEEVPKAARVLLSKPDTMRCELCQIDRPFTASHCYDCGVCVDKLDHHCPVSCRIHSLCLSSIAGNSHSPCLAYS
jgi:hypothetical protein